MVMPLEEGIMWNILCLFGRERKKNFEVKYGVDLLNGNAVTNKRYAERKDREFRKYVNAFQCVDGT